MSPGRRDLLILGAVGAGAAVAGGVAGALALQSRSGAADLLSASFPDLSGRRQPLAEWRGRPLVCNFWASWCEPCREELPLLDAAQQEHGANRLQIVGIAVDNGPNILKYLKSVQISYPVLIADGEAIDLMRRLGNRAGGLPFTVTLDTAGRVHQRKLGAYSAAELKAELAKLLR
jgi:thiol-disulfide isomerase/thioredoxin